jgi:hypothetical protein
MTQATENNGTNVIIKNVELHWVKLDPKNPISPFGVAQWEISAQVPKSRAAELEAFGKIREVKDKDSRDTGRVSINFKKKAEKKDGTDAAPVRVVDMSKQPLDPKTIGNGSIGNVMLFTKPYEIKTPKGVVTKSGTSVMLTAVQVSNLVKYEPKNSNFVDFDDDGDEQAPTGHSPADF